MDVSRRSFFVDHRVALFFVRSLSRFCLLAVRGLLRCCLDDAGLRPSVLLRCRCESLGACQRCPARCRRSPSTLLLVLQLFRCRAGANLWLGVNGHREIGVHGERGLLGRLVSSSLCAVLVQPPSPFSLFPSLLCSVFFCTLIDVVARTCRVDDASGTVLSSLPTNFVPCSPNTFLPSPHFLSMRLLCGLVLIPCW
jgi:hypothetical protein